MDITDIPLPKPAFIAPLCEFELSGSDVSENKPEIVRLIGGQSKAGYDIVYAPMLSADAGSAGREIVSSAKKTVENGVRIAGRILPLKCKDCEYEGDIDFFDAFGAYFRQARMFYESGVDLLAVKDMPSVAQARAAVLACKRFDIPVIATICVDETGVTGCGTSALATLICLQEMGICAFGVSGKINGDEMCRIISEIAPYAKVKLIADFESESGMLSDKAVCELVMAGAGIIGGYTDKPSLIKSRCCESVSAVKGDDLDDMLVLSNETQAFFLSPDNIEISEYIQCSQDMSDVLLELEDTNTDIIGIELFSPDDAVLFMENVHMASLPVIFKSQSITALTTALILYPGRACIDSCCTLEKDVLCGLAKKYGAIIY